MKRAVIIRTDLGSVILLGALALVGAAVTGVAGRLLITKAIRSASHNKTAEDKK